MIFAKENTMHNTNLYRYVYFIQGETTKRIKIGIAWNPKQRIIELQAGSPDRLSLLLTLRTVNSADDERHLHHQFKDFRLHGEWFEAAPEILQFVTEQNIRLANLQPNQKPELPAPTRASVKPAKAKE
jgi:hypothetical protein